MTIPSPRFDDLARIAESLGFPFEQEDAELFAPFIADTLESYDRLERLPDPLPLVRYPRTPGFRPAPAENPLGAWYWRTRIEGAGSGPLAGKTVAIKDNVCVAGVPMMNGTSVLEGYVPEVDATVVERILDAGGTILGKAVCEALCLSISSHTSATGPVRNPHDLSRTTGGSSSGSAALVAAGEVDMAIGGDQGGSIRIPSAYCGIYGLKPTHGLVPYTGIFPIEMTLDHAGPMARTVRDTALLLEVIAGPDGLDPRQSPALTSQPYVSGLSAAVAGLRIGVVEEGFGWPGVSDRNVDEAVMAASEAFGGLDAEVRRISIPMHREGNHLWSVIGMEGGVATLIDGNGMGSNWKGQYLPGLAESFHRGRVASADLLPDTFRFLALMGTYMREQGGGRFYARGRNLARLLTAAYDAALEGVDLLLMPTMPTTAPVLPADTRDRLASLQAAWGFDPNTGAFDITGHPAMNVPCGTSGGLPVGMMLIGRHGQDATVLRAAHAYETGVAAAPAVPPAT